MKSASLRVAAFFLVALFTISMNAQIDNKDYDLGGGGGSSCKMCQSTTWANYTSMNCGSVNESGGWGKENCRIESYPEGTYCFLDGNDCCVD